ncbi:MAG: DUF4126 domain-containing protein [Bacteroidia bacterium]|nr:DUF4126 domain-containing protein [Bacteroidia bacterium]
MTVAGLADAPTMEILLSVALGVGLSAACGFRVFVPLLGISIASMAGHVGLGDGFAWMASWPALIAFGTATVVEIAAYYIPWLDNLLDTITGPLAVLAGIMATASVVGDMSPLLRWSLALIGGGGIAALVQAGTTVLRAGSTGLSGGLSNPILSTVELGSSTVMTVLAVLLPLFAAGAALILGTIIVIRFRRRLFTGRSAG